MSNFIFTNLRDDSDSFIILSSVIIDGERRICHFKIDSGCSFTTVNYQKLYNSSHFESMQKKQQDINSKIPYMIGYGVNDTAQTKMKDKQLLKSGQLMQCQSIKFIRENVEMSLKGYDIIGDISISYDRENNSLLGMNILKKFEIVWGESIKTGDCVLLGCLKERITSEYLNAVEEHFGFTRKERVLASLIDEYPRIADMLEQICCKRKK